MIQIAQATQALQHFLLRQSSLALKIELQSPLLDLHGEVLKPILRLIKIISKLNLELFNQIGYLVGNRPLDFKKTRFMRVFYWLFFNKLVTFSTKKQKISIQL
jgi:hypothetical protein